MIPFNVPHLTGNELRYIEEAHARGRLAGDGYFTEKCSRWLERETGSGKVLLTHSCTGALEMAAILAGIGPGDEVIMPSYTFVSTANAFVLRGAVPVFIDVRPDTLNMDELLIEAAITPRTKAIVPVHYAGVACEMDSVMDIAHRNNLLVIEDAAQGVMSAYKEKPLGAIGAMGCLSFHETKNVISGEGGALLVNEEKLVERAEIIREKGTNRCQFVSGQVDKYTWVDIGSSYLPGEITAAFLWAQLESASDITERRLQLWNAYHAAFEKLEAKGVLRRPVIPDGCRHNAHMYYVLFPSEKYRNQFIRYMADDGIGCVFHYIPLHSSPAGRRFGRTHGTLPNTTSMAARLVRLPLWIGLEHIQDTIVDKVIRFQPS